MSISRHVVELASVVALAANLAGAAVAEPVSPGPEIDQADWTDTNAWSCAKTIAILPPTVSGEFKGPQPADAYTRRFAEGLAAGLRQRLGEGSVSVVSTTDAVTADLIITGEFVTLTGGSWAQRFWVGLGAGKSWADLRLLCIRRETGSRVFSLRQERGSAMGLKKDELMENVEEITQDVVAYLGGNVGVCDQAAWGNTTASDASAPVPTPPPAPPVFAPVTITTKPDGAEVSIDGESVGTTPLVEFQLEVGSHKIEIRKPGFRYWGRTFAVREGPTTRLDIKLEAEKPGDEDREKH